MATPEADIKARLERVISSLSFIARSDLRADTKNKYIGLMLASEELLTAIRIYRANLIPPP